MTLSRPCSHLLSLYWLSICLPAYLVVMMGLVFSFIDYYSPYGKGGPTYINWWYHVSEGGRLGGREQAERQSGRQADRIRVLTLLPVFLSVWCPGVWCALEYWGDDYGEPPWAGLLHPHTGVDIWGPGVLPPPPPPLTSSRSSIPTRPSQVPLGSWLPYRFSGSVTIS